MTVNQSPNLTNVDPGAWLTHPSPGPVARVAPVLGVALVTIAASGILAVRDPNEAGHYPGCPFLEITGWYCPGCGSLRAVHALATGDVPEAWDRNPLFVLAVPLLVASWVVWARRRVFGRPRRWLAPGWAIWGIFVVLMGFWVLRNIPMFSWLAP